MPGDVLRCCCRDRGFGVRAGRPGKVAAVLLPALPWWCELDDASKFWMGSTAWPVGAAAVGGDTGDSGGYIRLQGNENAG